MQASSQIIDMGRGTIKSQWKHQAVHSFMSRWFLLREKNTRKKKEQSLDAKICQINLHHHYLLVMYTSIQGWFNSY